MPNDLIRVGPRKPVGYMPLKELDDLDGVRKDLESRGLSVVVMDDRECNIESGAMVAYDRDALGSLLKSHRSILAKSQWPDDPDSFIRHHMIHNAPFRTKLYDLVADAYGDFENHFRSNSRSGAKVAVSCVTFGLLHAFKSHLF
jgi:hypothetical protein